MVTKQVSMITNLTATSTAKSSGCMHFTDHLHGIPRHICPPMTALSRGCVVNPAISCWLELLAWADNFLLNMKPIKRETSNRSLNICNHFNQLSIARRRRVDRSTQ
ncbi:hypothetical protein AHF37_09886 [Paragonimus kellicotti]|nr:hypothetical protein AHF37_09886 [Paragonimus kellicotti]